MRIITGANKSYETVLNTSVANTLRVGYEVSIFNLGGLSHGEPFPDAPQPTPRPGYTGFLGRCPYKPRVIYHAMINSPVFTVWFDADAFAIRPFGEVATSDYDIGVTMRRPSERGKGTNPDVTGYINAGVMFFNPTLATMGFLKRWISQVEQEPTQSDQVALNRLLLKFCDMTGYGRVFTDPSGVRVKIFRTDDYNFYYYPEEPLRTTKILHLKTHVRSADAWRDWTTRDWR